MSIFPLEYLGHIMDEIEYLMDQSANLSQETFLKMKHLRGPLSEALRLLEKQLRRSLLILSKDILMLSGKL